MARSDTLVMVAPGELFAGAERQILALLVHLRADGYRTTLVVFHDRELARRADELGLDVVILPGEKPFRRAAITRIAALVREKNAGIVHFHGYKAALHVALARRLVPFESVTTIHGAPESGGALLGRIRALLYDRCEHWAIAVTRARIVFVTQDLVRKIPSLAARGPHHVIPNGIDPQTIANLSRPTELSSSQFNVVIVGRLDAVKGIGFALQALADASTPAQIKLWIVGDGPERSRLEAQVSAAGLRQRVGFTGFRADAAAFIAHANLLLMPSLHEGLPYTMLEAISAATPIAASQVGGLAENLENQRTAFLFPPGDTKAIAACMSAAAEQPAVARAIGLRARAELLPRFEAARMARDYEHIYSQLSSARSQPAYP